VLIDTSGDLEGVPYDDAVGMGQALADHPSLGPCLVRTLFRYAVGREVERAEEPLIEHLSRRLAGSGHRLTELLREVALSDGFRTTSGPRELAESGDAS